MQSQNIIRLPQTIQKTGLSRSTIYALVKSGDFPRQIKLSPRTMGFLESDVDAWLSDRVAASKLGERTTAWRVSDIKALVEKLGA